MSVAAFIGSQRAEHGVPHAVTCRALGLSESWFYKWRDRPPTPRQVRRAELAEQIRVFFDASGGTYGSPRITLDLWAAGYQVSENTVAKLMAQLGLAGAPAPPAAAASDQAGQAAGRAGPCAAKVQRGRAERVVVRRPH
mgnify:CR=1 FL=1